MLPALWMAFAMAFGGCATESRYEARVNSWVGKSKDSLIQAWGQPDSIENRSNGQRIMLYSRLRHKPVTHDEAQRNVASAGSDTGGIYIKCATFFVLDSDNSIVQVFFKGGDCKSRD